MKKTTKRLPMHRVNTRIRQEQAQFIKDQPAKSKGHVGEGEFHRHLLDLGIEAYKAKK